MEATADVVLKAFRKCWLFDASTARPGRLDEYQALFPGHEAVVAAEYRRLSSEYPSKADSHAAAETHVGPYRLDGLLGRGGQGSVYAATDTRDGRVVALKVLTADAGISERRLARLRREAEAVARVDHPGICRIHEAGIEGDVPYLALHLVPGRTLADAIGRARRGGPAALATVDAAAALNLPAGDESSAASALQRVARFFEEAARAVHAAHEAGLVHRDVKPGNLMITPEGAPVVLDFGLARDEEEGRTITLTGALLGTPGYMAPEQTAPGAPRLDRRVDVYALGVSLFEALTLMHPFEAPTMDAAARAGLRHEPRDLRQLDPRFPKDLALIVATAMRRDRDRRFVTALALAEDLRAFRLGRRIATRPPGVVRRLRDWAALHPATASASAVAAVSLVAVLSVTLHLNTELRTALGDAHAANDRSLELVRFMIGDLTAQLSAIGKTQLLEAVAAKAAAHFETVDLDRLSPDGLATMADAWSTLGRAYELGGLRKKQYECREKAFAILERLGPGVEEDESRAALVAAFHAWRARRAQGTGRLEAGLAEYRMADARLSSISGTPHYDTTARNEHLMTLLALGMLERRLAVPGSLETIRRAKETGDRLVAEVPDNSNIRVEAENAAYQLAVSLDDEGRLTPALALAEEAARRARAFRDEHADQPFARAALADTLLRLSDLLLDSGATEAARAAAAESRDMYVELHALDPSFIRWTNFNVMAHARLVRALLAGRRVAEALEVTRVLRPLVDDARKVEAVASDPWAQTEVSSVLRTCAAAHRDAGLAAEAMEELDAAGALVEKASRAAPNELFARLAVIRQRQELAAWLCDTAPADDAAERRTRAARALALLGEADAVAIAGKAGGVASVRFERDRAWILRMTARARRLGGDDAGAVAALEEASRIRDGLAARDPAYVARLADLDTLLADARAAAK